MFRGIERIRRTIHFEGHQQSESPALSSKELEIDCGRSVAGHCQAQIGKFKAKVKGLAYEEVQVLPSTYSDPEG